MHVQFSRCILQFFYLHVSAQVSSHLTYHINCRHLVQLGGLLVAVGLLLSAFAKSIATVYVGFGVLGGIGFGIAFPPTYIVINQYFNEKRSVAFALSTLGIGLGPLCLGPLVGYWLTIYGYTGTVLLITGVCFHIQVAAALMRPPPAVQEEAHNMRGSLKVNVHAEREDQDGRDRLSVNVHYEQECHDVRDCQSERRREEQEDQDVRDGPEMNVHNEQENQDGRDNLKVNAHDEQENQDSRDLSVNVHDEQEDEGDEQTPVENKHKQITSKLHLLRSLSFLLYLLNIWTCETTMVVTYLPAVGREIGVSRTRASWIVSMSGLADILGRVASGLIFYNIKHGWKRMYHSSIGILIGVIQLSVGFAGTCVSLSIMVFFVTFAEAIFSAQKMEVLFEFIPKASISSAVGMILFTELFGMVLSPVIHGFLYAKYTTYSIGFVIAGSLFACTSPLMFIDYIRVKYYKK